MARLRERMYVASLQQEVEFVERGEGDVLSRLSVDSSIVGERCVPFLPGKTSSSHLLVRQVGTPLFANFRLLYLSLSFPTQCLRKVAELIGQLDPEPFRRSALCDHVFRRMYVTHRVTSTFLFMICSGRDVLHFTTIDVAYAHHRSACLAWCRKLLFLLVCVFVQPVVPRHVGVLWPLPKATIKQDARSAR